MTYAEWILNGKLFAGVFDSWAEFHTATFNPGIGVRVLVDRKRRRGYNHNISEEVFTVEGAV